MRLARDDDDEGKYAKASNMKARSAALTAALLVGLCLGIMASEKLYLASQEAELEPGALAAVRSRKLEVGAGGAGAAGAAGLRRMGGKPRSPLEELLRDVAPNGEVMIAISNMNLIHEQSLTLWLEVRAGGWMVGEAAGVMFAVAPPQPQYQLACCMALLTASPAPAPWLPHPHYCAAVRAAHRGPDQLAGGGHRRAAARLPAGAGHRALLPPRRHPRLSEGHGQQPRHLGHEVRNHPRVPGAGLGRAAEVGGC